MFPDYTNPRTVEWWTQLCLEFKDVLDYDGIWIVSPIIFAFPSIQNRKHGFWHVLLFLLKDMNEPSNDLTGQLPGCAANDINNPPYIPSE